MGDGRSISREGLEAFRFRAVELRAKGYSVEQISEIFGVHYNSVSRWFVKARAGGVDSLKRTYARGASLKLDEETMSWLKESLIKPATDWKFDVPLWNSIMVQTLLSKERNQKLGSVTVWRYLQRLGLTYQKPEERYLEQNQELVDRWIKKEWPKVQRWVKENRAILYFEDESGVSMAPVIGKTWAPKGQTPIVRVTGKRGGITAMSAISPSGKLRFRLEDRRINSDIMIGFIKQIMHTHKRRKIALVMDRASCHISKKLLAYVESTYNLKLFHIPPRSPELNPDEKVWRHLKHVELKNHQAQNKDQLRNIVLAKLRAMQKNPKMTKNFFKNYLT